MSHERNDERHDNPEHHTHHIVGPATYFAVFVALMVLMAATIAASFLDLGFFNLPLALVIAVVKTLLIIMFFMEVKYGSRLLWLFAGSSFVFLLIMFALTMNDYLTRNWYPSPV